MRGATNNNEFSIIGSENTDGSLSSSGALHSACEALLSEQSKLVGVSEAINAKLCHFSELDALTQKLHAPSLTVLNDGFIPLLTRIDECLNFLENHVGVVLDGVCGILFADRNLRSLNSCFRSPGELQRIHELRHTVSTSSIDRSGNDKVLRFVDTRTKCSTGSSRFATKRSSEPRSRYLHSAVCEVQEPCA